ncbi:hypothetical protein A2291_03665 [candidate division WOR-1 bacterium RIFOXYB2_FULL_42_35]|uniref:Uncharacterized protein n=1 Tax=candidate division WOR-1 bacterium RIFOXYC2_FULL_41_25 TaxID=1802586 RepID=A0A1F4TQI8_UNCSA|nr:MAG: hypothetical protein A2247_03235 [candidate division WOR-1 bacterium RIFOXYA2_FULL_41_14]OGC25560.1 MAG: hypothetical protein A2291_03665 [candidate division WOR-1 bacterium RIFOXYB2_FULL_42_35]OGC34992.1 MAG: hypothetical protein A2462_05295 [candidate division WOR-1 bacterium RIFOXYC2_FULL_41_25]
MSIHPAYTVSGFYALARQAIPLEPWQHRVPDPIYRNKVRTKANIPEKTGSLIPALLVFARYAGLKSIPASTIARFQDDPYLKYCFIGLIDDHQRMYFPCHSSKSKSGEIKEKWKACLSDPDKLKEEDLYRGLACYLNNFMGCMPGGDFCKMTPNQIGYSQRKNEVMIAIDNVLALSDLRIQAKQLAAAAYIEQEKRPDQYVNRVAHLKFCLEIFHHLAEEHGFSTIDLWS